MGIFKNAAVGEIGSTFVQPPTNKPTPKPTTVSEGCFSNNYKDCLPKSLSNELKSCNTVWLPNGAQQGCIALWGDCATIAAVAVGMPCASRMPTTLPVCLNLIQRIPQRQSLPH